jgi:class 3 adenylate cyclase
VEEIRKRPATRIGLAMGADRGRIAFRDLDSHLVAVGDAIVWASRMAAIADASEVVLNNLLAARLRGHEEIELAQKEGKTKSGEAFLAQVMRFR